MPNDKRLYLDYNATTPVDPSVAEAMRPYLEGCFGNPSSSHPFGQEARAAIEKARCQVAGLLECEPREIVFTSGGTEANNQAIIGAAEKHGKGGHIVTTAIEHPAVTEVCRYLEKRGVKTTFVEVDRHGLVDPARMIDAFRKDTFLVTMMLANNEVGTLQPVTEVAMAAREQGIMTHSDCAQAVGKVPVKASGLGVDFLSVAGHKLYAPKGIGVLYVKDGVELPTFMHGAGHESGRRPGTENILEIVGLGKACELASEGLATEMERLSGLRDELQQELTKAIPTARVNGHPDLRLPNTLSIGFPGVTADDLMASMPDLAVSAGAACHGGGATISHVLQAMSVDHEVARGTLRLSLGRMSTTEDIKRGAALIIEAVKRLS